MRRSIALLLVAVLCLGGCTNPKADTGQEPVEASPSASLPSEQADDSQVEAEERLPDTYIPLAVDYIESRLAEFDQVLYVYKDFVDGANNYTQKAWLGDSNNDIPEMREDAQGRNGTTGIMAEIDLTKHAWGGYMFVNGILYPGETVPALDFGWVDAGLDLTGASKLVFYAKGEKGGECLQFFLGGLGTDVLMPAVPYPDTTGKVSLHGVTLSSEWKRYEIPLSYIADKSRVGCGFGWTASGSQNPGAQSVRFYLDDICYEFDEPRLQPLFLTSYEPAPPGTDEAVINNFAYLYDNAAAALALSYAGKHGRARQIADAMVYALEHDRFFTDGRLRNAYCGGNPKSFPGWQSARDSEFARLPGFYDTEAQEYYEDMYAASTSTGNCAWAMLALLEVYANAPDHTEYLDAAIRIADFVLTLQTGNGFTGGYEGWEPDPVKVGYKSTEHNTDLIAAFGRLAQITGEQQYAVASDNARAFVLSMYDAYIGCFYTGTQDDGITVSTEVIPLDCQTWTLCVLRDSFADSDRVLRFIEERIAIDGGYDFEADSKDGVWFEGTAQMGILYHLTGNTQKAAEIQAYLEMNRLQDGSITAADRDGVTTGFLVTGTDIPWVYGKRQHLGATCWLAFLQLGARNPFAY
ncbi:MAG: hypothetical protein FWF91_01085 [Coriobacteriia bacterium]|nr:hypothetical protein [Coriobacteriia bacterium]